MKKGLLIVLSLVMILNFAGCGQANTVEIVKCLYCGESNAADANFCAYCGKPFMLSNDGTADNDSSGSGKNESNHEVSTNGEGEPLPPEDLYVMQNSGAKDVHYGSNICIDGDMIYLGYYGSLYVFCGNEVATYAGGGSTMSSMAEIYLYNGYVYYANQSNHCIYRMSVADGKREVVLSDIGDIQNTFMLKNILFIESDVTDRSNNVIYTLNLDTLENKELIRDDRPYQLIQIDNDHQLLMSDTDGKTLRLLRMNAIDGKAEELWSMNVLESIFYVTPKTEGPYIYFRISGFDESGEDVSVYYKFNQENYIAERSTRDEYNNISNGPNDDYEWQYYLAWGSNNLCREHKETGVQELLLRSGSGQREEGETVAKTYAINEIIYADDTRIIFQRSRMADGLERSVWMVDSDGNNLIELIRKEYHANEPEPYPTGTPGVSGGSSGNAGSSSDSPAVGTKTCALCEGDGRITCYYCKGSGKGPTIYVVGIPTEQGCTYCGSAGWRLCSGCGGRGEK